MITIVCPHCQKRYTFDETMIPADLELIECRLCRTRFPLDLETENPAREAANQQSKAISFSAFTALKSPSDSGGYDLTADPGEESPAEEQDPVRPLSSFPNRCTLEMPESDSRICLSEAIDEDEEQSCESRWEFADEEVFTVSNVAHSDHVGPPGKEKLIRETVTPAQTAFCAKRFKSLHNPGKRSEKESVFYGLFVIVCLALISYFIFTRLL